MVWLKFIISAVVIIFAGIRLTTDADVLSEKLQLGKVWVGIILLGLVTSLPEAVTSLVSVIYLRADNLAIGNLLGSNNFNPMLIVVMDVMYRQGSVTNAISPNASHTTSARFAILLVAIVIVDILINTIFPSAHIGLRSAGSILIALCYFIGMRQLALLGTGQSVSTPISPQTARQDVSMVRISLSLAFSAFLVIVGAVLLAQSADIIAQQTGLGGTFFGSIFLAFVTSLPEMVVSLAALKLGSLDLAVGNIFGSNMTNMFIVFICGLFHRNGPILGAVSKVQIITAVLSILLTYVAIKGICTRDKKTIFGLGIDSLIMIFLFIVGTSILYQLRLV